MIALATYRDEPGLAIVDSLLIEPFRKAQIEWAAHPWDEPRVPWSTFDLVIVRTTWDYYRRPAEFRAWIDARDADGTRLWNPPEVLRWNMHKAYLRDIAAMGIDVVQTEWLSDAVSLQELLRERGWERAVVKPAVSAAAFQTRAVTGTDDDQAFFEGLVANGEVMVQPFLQEIVDEGEWSLVFFNSEFSHALVKSPATGDFRVQERHGGATRPATPPADLIAQTEKIVEATPLATLYARVDGVRSKTGFKLIELEVLEPALYFEEGPGSAERFIDAIAKRL